MLIGTKHYPFSYSGCAHSTYDGTFIHWIHSNSSTDRFADTTFERDGIFGIINATSPESFVRSFQRSSKTDIMASHKIAKKNGPADELELSVAQALFDLESNANDLKAELTPLQISSAKEVSLSPRWRTSGNRKQDRKSITLQGLS